MEPIEKNRNISVSFFLQSVRSLLDIGNATRKRISIINDGMKCGSNHGQR